MENGKIESAIHVAQPEPIRLDLGVVAAYALRQREDSNMIYSLAQSLQQSIEETARLRKQIEELKNIPISESIPVPA